MPRRQSGHQRGQVHGRRRSVQTPSQPGRRLGQRHVHERRRLRMDRRRPFADGELSADAHHVVTNVVRWLRPSAGKLGLSSWPAATDTARRSCSRNSLAPSERRARTRRPGVETIPRPGWPPSGLLAQRVAPCCSTCFTSHPLVETKVRVAAPNAKINVGTQPLSCRGWEDRLSLAASVPMRHGCRCRDAANNELHVLKIEGSDRVTQRHDDDASTGDETSRRPHLRAR